MLKYFKGRESLLDKIIDIFTFIFAAIMFLTVDAGGVTPDINYIPTISNGITATTSIIVGATGLALTFAHTNKLVKRNKPWANRIYYTFAFLMLAISFVFLTYVAMTWGDYVKAIRTAMAGLIIAGGTFANFTLYVLRRYVEPTLTD